MSSKTTKNNKIQDIISVFSAYFQRLFRVPSAPLPRLFRDSPRSEGLTKSNKKSIIDNDGEGSFVRVWGQLRAFTKTLPSSLHLRKSNGHTTARKENAMNRVSDSLFGATARARYARAAIALTVTLLAACGGGGGGTSNTCTNGASDYPTCTPQDKKPTIGNLTWSEAAGATVKKDATISVSVTTTDATSVTGTLITTCNSLPVAGATMASFTLSGSTGTSTVSAPTNYGDSCTHQAKLVAHGAGGDSTELAGSLTFTVEASPCVAPKVTAKVGTLNVCATPVGMKAPPFNKVPAGCVETTHDMFEKCWLDFAASENGVQWVQTLARATGSAVNPINGAANDGPAIFGCYIDKADNTLCDIFMVDTGRVFANGGVNRTTVHEPLQKDWVVGTQNGIISHVVPDDKCYELTWYPPTTQTGVNSDIWSNTLVNCPTFPTP